MEKVQFAHSSTYAVANDADFQLEIHQPLGDPDDPDATHAVSLNYDALPQLERMIKDLKARLKGKAPQKPRAASQHFDSFWLMYPAHRRFARSQCLQKWSKQGLDALWPDIEAYLSAQVLSNDWVKEGGKYVPLPATFINQRRWEAGQSVVQRKII